MEHWAQKCDGAGVDPAEYAAVCRERDELKAQLAQVTAERDAAVEDLRSPLDNCKVCRHGNDAFPGGCDGDCMECGLDCFCKDCRNGSKFEWRGVQEGGEG